MNCPKCGNEVANLIPIEAGLRVQLEEAGQVGFPEEVCANCFSELRKSGTRGARLRIEAKAVEENRLKLWNGRVNLVRQGRALMRNRSYADAAVAYEKYLRSLEIAFDVKGGSLGPDHFKSKARQKELTVITSVYWDLVCIYDISQKYGNRQMKAADKLAEFARFTPIYQNIIRKAQGFQKKSRNPRVIKRFLKNSNASRPRCFVATAVFDDPGCMEIEILRLFRDRVLRQSYYGRVFTRLYYKFSPPLADWIERTPILQSMLRPVLRAIAVQIPKKFNLNSKREF